MLSRSSINQRVSRGIQSRGQAKLAGPIFRLDRNSSSHSRNHSRNRSRGHDRQRNVDVSAVRNEEQQD